MLLQTSTVQVMMHFGKYKSTMEADGWEEDEILEKWAEIEKTTPEAVKDYKGPKKQRLRLPCHLEDYINNEDVSGTTHAAEFEGTPNAVSYIFCYFVGLGLEALPDRSICLFEALGVNGFEGVRVRRIRVRSIRRVRRTRV